VDKATLLKGYLPEADVELPSGLGTVRIRGLSRQEAVAVSKVDDQIAMERKAIACGLLDPKMTEAEVDQWSEVAVAADVQAVAQAISELSNMAPNSGKGRTSRSKRTGTSNSSST
jgi:hypothetical protein